MTNNRNALIKIIENYYEDLYSSKTRKPPNITRMIQNVGLEEIEEIQIDKIRKAVEELKNNRAPGYDAVIPELIKLGDIELLKTLKILLNKCISERKLSNYRPISLFNLMHKLLTKIIKN